LARWEDKNGNVRTWDNATLTSQYTENPVAQIRNILLHRRYGLGRSIRASDFNYASWVESLKEAHRTWDPYSDANYNFCSWWSGASISNSEWDYRIVLYDNEFTFGSGNYVTVAKDPATRKISSQPPPASPIPTPNYRFSMDIKLPGSLDTVLGSYRMIVTLNNHSSPSSVIVNAAIGGRKMQWRSFKQVTTTISSHKITIEMPPPGTPYYTDKVYLSFYSGQAGVELTGEVTSVEILRGATGALTNFHHFHSCNGVAESSQASETFFTELCNPFRLWLLNLGKQLHIKSNVDELPIHTISDTNIVKDSFEQSFSPLSSIPYIVEAQYTDANRQFELTPRLALVPVVEANRTVRQDVGFKYITDQKQIDREMNFHVSLLTNCNHLVSFRLSSEFLHATAGDVFNLQHSVPNWGAGQSGRVTSFQDGSRRITLDKAYTFNNVGSTSFSILYIGANNVSFEAGIDMTGISESQSLTNIHTTVWAGDPSVDSSYVIGIDDYNVKKFRLFYAKRDYQNIVSINGVIHSPEAYVGGTVKIMDGPIDVKDASYDLELTDFRATQIISLTSNTLKFDVALVGVTVSYFTVEMSRFANSGFTQITTIDGSLRSGIYMVSSDSMIDGATYYFRAFAKNIKTQSNFLYSSFVYTRVELQLNPPTGLRIVGVDNQFSSNFNSKNLTIAWNPVSAENCKYIVEIYKAVSDGLILTDPRKLVRSAIVYENQYIYTLSDNVSDGGGVANASLNIRVFTQMASGAKTSPPSILLEATNSVPAVVLNLVGVPVVGAVQFLWTASLEEDHKCYLVRTQVGSGSWSGWLEHGPNSYLYQLTETEISTYGKQAVVYIEVKDKDWYEQLSASATAQNQTANTVSDSIFLLSASASAGTGNLSELFNGAFASGGWTIG
jgi:hypothetical protein